VIQAKKLQRRLLVKYTKIVGKYLSTEWSMLSRLYND
jgi:hypothetical protein